MACEGNARGGDSTLPSLEIRYSCQGVFNFCRLFRPPNRGRPGFQSGCQTQRCPSPECQCVVNRDHTYAEVFHGVTALDGTVNVRHLEPGEYRLSIVFLGIGGVYECFRVARWTPRRARQQLEFEWAGSAPATRRMAGKLVDSQLTVFQGEARRSHRAEVPVVGATLRLENPFTRTVVKTLTDEHGMFAFDSTPTGTYVLHIEGKSGLPSDDLPVRISPASNGDSLLIERSPDAGSCRGPTLKVLNSGRPD